MYSPSGDFVSQSPRVPRGPGFLIFALLKWKESFSLLRTLSCKSLPPGNNIFLTSRQKCCDPWSPSAFHTMFSVCSLLGNLRQHLQILTCRPCPKSSSSSVVSQKSFHRIVSFSESSRTDRTWFSLPRAWNGGIQASMLCFDRPLLTDHCCLHDLFFVTTFCLPPFACCFIVAASCWLFTDYCFLLTAYWLLSSAYCLPSEASA